MTSPAKLMHAMKREAENVINLPQGTWPKERIHDISLVVRVGLLLRVWSKQEQQRLAVGPGNAQFISIRYVSFDSGTRGHCCMVRRCCSAAAAAAAPLPLLLLILHYTNVAKHCMVAGPWGRCSSDLLGQQSNITGNRQRLSEATAEDRLASFYSQAISLLVSVQAPLYKWTSTWAIC